MKMEKTDQIIATREAYGDALVELGKVNPNIIVLDAEMSPSTYADRFKKEYPKRFLEMYMAEQNMISVALGLSKYGFITFSSTFASFLTRSFDQIRMAQYSNPNLKIIGSHAGVSVGEDGASQMGLEDIAMMRSILNSIVFYPSDGTSTKKLVEIMAKTNGLFYLRTTRDKTPIIYREKEKFKIGGCKTHRIKIKQAKLKVLLITAGITFHEALKAQKKLATDKIETTVVDLYCVKPIDKKTLINLIKKYPNVIVIEDHYPYGGIGEAVANVIKGINFIHLCVRKIPRSGSARELLQYEEIDETAIIKAVKKLTKIHGKN